MAHSIQPAHGTTSTGLAPNVAGALSYLLGVVSGVLFLVVEKENEYVRFHAAQSVVVFGALFVVNIALRILSAVIGVIPGVGDLLAMLLGLATGIALWVATLAIWIVLMVMAFTGSTSELPVVARYARQLAASVRV